MMKNFKLGIRILKYCYGIKQCVGLSILFFVVGGLFYYLGYFIGRSNYSYIAYVYWWLIGMSTVQLLSSLNVSSMVQSSPEKKALQTSVPVLVTLPVLMATYGLTVLVKTITIWTGRISVQEVAGDLVIMGLYNLVLMVYMGMAFKLFAVGTVLFCGVTVLMSFFSNWLAGSVFSLIPLGAAILIGLAAVLLGSCLQYLISMAVYRLPLSRTAQLRKLQKYM